MQFSRVSRSQSCYNAFRRPFPVYIQVDSGSCVFCQGNRFFRVTRLSLFLVFFLLRLLFHRRAFLGFFLLLEIFASVIGSVKTAPFQNVTHRMNHPVDAPTALGASFPRRFGDSLFDLELVAAFFTGVMVNGHFVFLSCQVANCC